jgi:hypothetical protein
MTSLSLSEVGALPANRSVSGAKEQDEDDVE